METNCSGNQVNMGDVPEFIRFPRLPVLSLQCESQRDENSQPDVTQNLRMKQSVSPEALRTIPACMSKPTINIWDINNYGISITS